MATRPNGKRTTAGDAANSLELLDHSGKLVSKDIAEVEDYDLEDSLMRILEGKLPKDLFKYKGPLDSQQEIVKKLREQLVKEEGKLRALLAPYLELNQKVRAISLKPSAAATGKPTSGKSPGKPKKTSTAKKPAAKKPAPKAPAKAKPKSGAQKRKEKAARESSAKGGAKPSDAEGEPGVLWYLQRIGEDPDAWRSRLLREHDKLVADQSVDLTEIPSAIKASVVGQRIANAAAADEPACCECGCTNETPCPGGCMWVDNPEDPTKELCSSCARAVSARMDARLLAPRGSTTPGAVNTDEVPPAMARRGSRAKPSLAQVAAANRNGHPVGV